MGGVPKERFVVDDRARRLPLGRAARRIASLAPSCTECLLEIGAGERLVGVEEHSALPPRLAALPRIGGFKHLDLGRLRALEPDLVVAASLHAVSVAPRLEAEGLPVFVMAPHTVDGMVDGMARLAALAGVAGDAAAYLGTCRSRIAAVVTRTVSVRRRPLAYVECSPERHTGGPSSFLDDLVAKAGGVSLGGVARVEWPVLPAATVLRHDPDVIVIARYPGSATGESLAARDGWERLSAVKGGRVYEVPAGMLKRPGPGLLDGLERLAAMFAVGGET